MYQTSVWQRPVASSFTRHSPGPGSSTSISSTISGLPISVKVAAFDFIATSPTPHPAARGPLPVRDDVPPPGDASVHLLDAGPRPVTLAAADRRLDEGDA